MIAISPDNRVRTGRGFIRARDLRPGDTMFDEKNNPLSVRTVKKSAYDAEFIKFGDIFVQSDTIVSGRVEPAANRDAIARTRHALDSLDPGTYDQWQEQAKELVGPMFGDFSVLEPDVDDMTVAIDDTLSKKNGSFIRGIVQYLYDSDLIDRFGYAKDETGHKEVPMIAVTAGLAGAVSFTLSPSGLCITPRDLPVIDSSETVPHYMPYPNRRFVDLLPEEKAGYLSASSVKDVLFFNDDEMWKVLLESKWVIGLHSFTGDDGRRGLHTVTAASGEGAVVSPSMMLGLLVGLGVPWDVVTSGEEFFVATHDPAILSDYAAHMPDSTSTAVPTMMSSSVHRVKVKLPDLVAFRTAVPRADDFTFGLLAAGAPITQLPDDSDGTYCLSVAVRKEDKKRMLAVSGLFVDGDDGWSTFYLVNSAVRYAHMKAERAEYQPIVFFDEGKTYTTLRCLSNMLGPFVSAPNPVALVSMIPSRDYYAINGLWTLSDGSTSVPVGGLTKNPPDWENASPLVRAGSNAGISMKSMPAFFDWGSDDEKPVPDVVSEIVSGSRDDLPDIAGIGLIDRHAIVELISPVVEVAGDKIDWVSDLVHSVGGDVEVSRTGAVGNVMISGVGDSAYDMIDNDFVVVVDGGVPERRISAPIVVETSRPDSFVQLGARGIPVKTSLKE